MSVRKTASTAGLTRRAGSRSAASPQLTQNEEGDHARLERAAHFPERFSHVVPLQSRLRFRSRRAPQDPPSRPVAHRPA